MSLKFIKCFYYLLWTYFTPFSSGSIVDFEQVNVSWDGENISVYEIQIFIQIQKYMKLSKQNFITVSFNPNVKKVRFRYPYTCHGEIIVFYRIWKVNIYFSGMVKSLYVTTYGFLLPFLWFIRD